MGEMNDYKQIKVKIYGELYPIEEIKDKTVHRSNHYNFCFDKKGKIYKECLNFERDYVYGGFIKNTEIVFEKEKEENEKIANRIFSTFETRILNESKTYDDVAQKLINGYEYIYKKEICEMEIGLITKISVPKFIKETSNKKDNTFDFVKVNIYIGSCVEGWKNKVKEYRKEIQKMAIKKIEESKRFQKYGIPINFLKIDKIWLCNCREVEITFSLKGTA